MSMTTPTGGANYNQTAGAGLITSVTPAPSTGARIPFQAGLARLPQTKQTPESALVQTYRNMSPAMRQALSQQLKDAGYRNPVTSKFNIKVREAFLDASRDLNDEIKSRFQTDPAYFENNKYDLSTFLKEMSNTGGGGDKGPNVIRYRQELRPEAIKATINEVFVDVLGRGASEEEIAKYTSRIQKQMGKKKNMAQTTYKDLGGGVQERTDRPAFSPQAFLFEELAGNNEAKQRSIFSFYDAFKKALGV
jgi:hypothetical protein